MLMAMNTISFFWEIATLELNLRVRQKTQHFETKVAVWLIENDQTSHA